MNFPNDANADIIRFEPSGYHEDALLDTPYKSKIIEPITYWFPMEFASGYPEPSAYDLISQPERYLSRYNIGLELSRFNSKVFADGDDLYVLNYKFNEDFDEVAQSVVKYNGSGLYQEWEYELFEDEFHPHYQNHLDYSKDKDIHQSYDIRVDGDSVVVAYNVSPQTYNTHLFNIFDSGISFLQNTYWPHFVNCAESGWYFSTGFGSTWSGVPDGIHDGRGYIWMSGAPRRTYGESLPLDMLMPSEYRSIYKNLGYGSGLPSVGVEPLFERIVKSSPLNRSYKTLGQYDHLITSGVEQPFSSWATINKNTGELIGTNTNYCKEVHSILAEDTGDWHGEVLYRYNLFRPIFNSDGASIHRCVALGYDLDTANRSNIIDAIYKYGLGQNNVRETSFGYTQSPDTRASISTASLDSVLHSGSAGSTFGYSNIIVNGQASTRPLAGLGFPLGVLSPVFVSKYSNNSLHPEIVDTRPSPYFELDAYFSWDAWNRGLENIDSISASYPNRDNLLFTPSGESYLVPLLWEHSIREPMWVYGDLINASGTNIIKHFNDGYSPLLAVNSFIRHLPNMLSGIDESVTMFNIPNYTLNPYRDALSVNNKLSNTGKFMNGYLYMNCAGASTGVLTQATLQPNGGYVLDIDSNTPICEAGCVKFTMPTEPYQVATAETLPMPKLAYSMLSNGNVSFSRTLVPLDIAHNEFKMVYKPVNHRYPESGVGSTAAEFVLLDNYGSVVSSHTESGLMNHCQNIFLNSIPDSGMWEQFILDYSGSVSQSVLNQYASARGTNAFPIIRGFYDYGFTRDGFMLNFLYRYQTETYNMNLRAIGGDESDPREIISARPSLSPYDYGHATTIIDFQGNARTVLQSHPYKFMHIPNNQSGALYLAKDYCESPISWWTPKDKDSNWKEFYDRRMAELYPEVDE